MGEDNGCQRFQCILPGRSTRSKNFPVDFNSRAYVLKRLMTSENTQLRCLLKIWAKVIFVGFGVPRGE